MAKKEKIKRATRGLFNKWFGFENGIDITNEVAVLHRRNTVIKNIILVSNMFFSMLLGVFAYLSDAQTNWIFPMIFLPLTFFINTIIKIVINRDRHDKVWQEVAMYGMALYVTIMVVLLYSRFFNEQYFSTSTYILLYYALVVISLYQSKPLMLFSSALMLALITIIHFTWTFKVSELAQGLTQIEFLKIFIKEPGFYDYLLRVGVFVIFTVALFAIVSIGHYMQEERRNELIKRREIQEDFTNIVSDLFKVVLSAKSPFLDRQHINLVHASSLRLAELYGTSEEQYNEINNYANIHLKMAEIKTLISPHEDYEVDFDEMKEKTELGTIIAKRMQLAQKVEDIARSHIEDVVTDDFVYEMTLIQPEITAQIIVLSDLYITMRSQQSYKRAYPNNLVMDLFKKQFNGYFDQHLLGVFLRFQDDFEKLYNES